MTRDLGKDGLRLDGEERSRVVKLVIAMLLNEGADADA